MVFSSHLFLFWFLPVALCIYYAVRGRARHAVLTLLSYIFYGWTNPLFVLLLFLSTLIDYCCGLYIMEYFDRPKSERSSISVLPKGGPRTRKQKAALVVSIVSNLSLLCFFKYGNFGIENWNALMSMLYMSDTWVLPALHIVLPLGISFYTFQSMSYSIDVYRGDARGITHFIDFACYVSMYPQLVAGPIIRFQEVADQLRHRTYSWEKFARGIAFFVVGLGQKVVLANPCGKVADWAFDAATRTAGEAWTGAIAYSFQIFFDFAGYSNMAIGLGLMLGFVFPKNFDLPYRSRSITEFWRRWHISLSSWLRDYLYIPLGGNRKGKIRTYVNLLTVMLLGGLWHGAAWNFIIWGGIHGVMLVVERTQRENTLWTRIPSSVKMLATYAVVVFAWVFFRAATLPDAWAYVQSMFGTGARVTGSGILSASMLTPYAWVSMVVAAAIVWCAPTAWNWTRCISRPKTFALLALFLLSIAALTSQSYNPFIYFIF